VPEASAAADNSSLGCACSPTIVVTTYSSPSARVVSGALSSPTIVVAVGFAAAFELFLLLAIGFTPSVSCLVDV
jgi:hypothetical protein